MQFRLGTGLETDVVLFAVTDDFFQNGALLVHLDREDAVVAPVKTVFLAGLVKAFVDLFLPYLRGENDADSENVVDLIERDMLVLHFIPNGIRTLHSRLDFVFYPHFVQRSFDGSRKLFEKFVALLLSKGQFAVDVFVFNGMFKLETKVFKLCLNLV